MADAFQVEHYLRRASDFIAGMQLMRDDPGYRNSSALLAIHSAVSYADALRIGLGDSSLSSDDHKSAVESLRALLAARRVSADSALRRFKDLLSRKNDVAYNEFRLDESTCNLLITNAERFST